uniref:Cation efflux protein transmembrane domain-containing protein n=1 Tax=Junco hyemalis TaxID=40217 RepID=A0A8C5J008_JUNHY
MFLARLDGALSNLPMSLPVAGRFQTKLSYGSCFQLLLKSTCRLIFMLVLTVGFFVAELVSGYLGNSIALVSDSFNMLSDLISLCVGLSTGRIARRSRRGPRATYGYSRAEAVGALSNAVFLTALCFTILVDSVLRLARPEPIDDAQLVLIVGTLGLAVNVVGLLVFQDWGACLSSTIKTLCCVVSEFWGSLLQFLT